VACSPVGGRTQSPPALQPSIGNRWGTRNDVERFGGTLASLCQQRRDRREHSDVLAELDTLVAAEGAQWGTERVGPLSDQLLVDH
jgi:hypothetical protein